MFKSYKQQKLEAQRDQTIEDIVVGALEFFRGRKNILTLVAADLNVKTATLYNWCHDLGISIDEYRRPVASTSQGD